MTQTVQQITSLNWKCHSIEMTQIKAKYVDLNQAGWPSDLRRQTQENPQSRILVHEWVRGFDSHSCQKTSWTRWARAFSWQILSYWNVNSRWQSKAKENQRLATSLGGWQPITLKVHKKEDTRRRHVRHDSTRGFKCKSFQIDDTSRLADYISELKCHSFEMTQIKRKYVDVNQAGWLSGLKCQTQEIPQSRILVHECVRGFESHSCQKTFWTRWSRAFGWQILSYWNVNSRWQSKAKENKTLATSLGGW